jgi:hypothetical protein
MIHLQSEQDVLPGEDIVFRGHDRVQPDVWRPVVSPYVLTGQSKQAVPPVEYVPALSLQSNRYPHHIVCKQSLMCFQQVMKIQQGKRRKHWHLSSMADVAPGRAYLPVGHVSERQGPPLPVEYVPAVQSMQLALDVLPADEDLPAGQFVHAVPPVEYVPTPHCVQAELVMLPAR